MCDNDNMVLSNESSSHLSSSSSMSNGPPPVLPQLPPPSSLSSLSSASFEAVASTAVAATKSISRPPDALLEDMASENYWLRQKMKEITADRDRLLCEVANLRLELDMAELKRLPEDK